MAVTRASRGIDAEEPAPSQRRGVWSFFSRFFFASRRSHAHSVPPDLSAIEWLDPWTPIADARHARAFEMELRRELARAHPLYRRAARAVAHRADRDDILFLAGHELAVVHLTYSSATEDPPAPPTRVFSSVAEFVSTCLQPDHDDYTC
jgi:hypothetical protein